MREIDDDGLVFLAHFTGGGILPILELTTDDYFAFSDSAFTLYEKEISIPHRVVLSGIEKR